MSADDWTFTARGFHLAELPFSDYEGNEPRTLQVQESSLATEDKLWVGPTEVAARLPDGQVMHMNRMHLGVEEVRWLRDRLSEWLDGVEKGSVI